MDATYPPFYTLLGRAYLEQDKIAEAEKVLVQHIELEGNKALAHAQVGKIYMSAEYFERAAVYFKEGGRSGCYRARCLVDDRDSVYAA